ncbi:MAG: PEGA domain-containing protein [Terriglobales bacterium]
MRKPIWIVPVLLLWAVAGALAADTVLTWPSNGNGNDTMLRFTLGKLRQISSVSGQSDYLGEALAENLSTKAIPSASFYLYLLDKNGKRVGEGYLEVTNLAAGQRAKIPVTAHALGSFASMELQPQHLPSDEPMKIKMSITSVPSGASLKLDSQESGVTPQVLPMAPGKHVLEFSKEGYRTESAPVEIAENALPGSVELELNPLTLDTVVLRDGRVLLGNVTSVTNTGVNINVKGKAMKLERSRVARIVLGGRKPSAGTPATAAGKSASGSKK